MHGDKNIKVSNLSKQQELEKIIFFLHAQYEDYKFPADQQCVFCTM